MNSPLSALQSGHCRQEPSALLQRYNLRALTVEKSASPTALSPSGLWGLGKDRKQNWAAAQEVPAPYERGTWQGTVSEMAMAWSPHPPGHGQESVPTADETRSSGGSAAEPGPGENQCWQSDSASAGPLWQPAPVMSSCTPTPVSFWRGALIAAAGSANSRWDDHGAECSASWDRKQQAVAKHRLLGSQLPDEATAHRHGAGQNTAPRQKRLHHSLFANRSNAQ